jgi:hypothetical protein
MAFVAFPSTRQAPTGLHDRPISSLPRTRVTVRLHRQAPLVCCRPVRASAPAHLVHCDLCGSLLRAVAHKAKISTVVDD